MSRLARDPRHFQIVTLSTLVALQMAWADFGPQAEVVAVTLLSVLVTQAVFSRLVGIPMDFRSPLITGLSLSILLKAGAIWVYPLAAWIAVGSKFALRANGKHIFNPANIGIVAVLLLWPQYVWISPGQWGNGLWLAFMMACFALLVLYRIPRRDMSFLFLGAWGALIFGRALWLGDPLGIPFNQMHSGALLIFAFFMISDPKTIPNTMRGRALFALAVAAVGYILQFEFQLREGLFYALALVCMTCPLIDRLWQAPDYQWTMSLMDERRKS